MCQQLRHFRNNIMTLQGCPDHTISISVQAEFFLFSDPTFLEGFDLKFHVPGHFPPWDVVFTYHPGHFAILIKIRTKLL